MAEPLKFTFDTAFGTRSENDEQNVELPVITQEEVDAARTQGFIQGREDGLAEATAQFDAEFKASLEQISNKLNLVLKQQSTTAQLAVEQAQNYALLIAQKIAKAALTQYPTDQIKNLIDDCLSHVSLMPHLVVRVNQSISQLTQEKLQPIIDQKGFEGKLIILGEQDIPLGDCMIEWADGGVAHNTQEIVKIISKKLVDYFGFDVEAVVAEDEAVSAEDEAISSEHEAISSEHEAVSSEHKEPLNEIDDEQPDNVVSDQDNLDDKIDTNKDETTKLDEQKPAEAALPETTGLAETTSLEGQIDE